MLVTQHIPDLDDAIFPTTGDRLPIGTDSNGAGPRLVSLDSSEIRTLLRIPPA